jgi:hypothetical protein
VASEFETFQGRSVEQLELLKSTMPDPIARQLRLLVIIQVVHISSELHSDRIAGVAAAAAPHRYPQYTAG